MADARSVAIDPASRAERAVARQNRIERAPDELPNSARDLLRQLRSYLLRCSREGSLLDAEDAVMKKLRLYPDREAYVIAVCDFEKQPKNFRRNRERAHFTRADGAWFDFGLTLREQRGLPIEIVAYDAELRFEGPGRSPAPP